VDIPTSPLIVYTLEGVIKKNTEDPVEIPIDPPSPIFSLALSTPEELRDVHVHYEFTDGVPALDLRPSPEMTPGVTSYHSYVIAMSSAPTSRQPFLFISLPFGSSPNVRNLRIDAAAIEVNFPLITKIGVWFGELRYDRDVPFRYCIGALGM
jgi:hypothetical protein